MSKAISRVSDDGQELLLHWSGDRPRKRSLEEDNELWCKCNLNKDLYCLLIGTIDKMSDEDKKRILEFIRYDVLKIQRLNTQVKI